MYPIVNKKTRPDQMLHILFGSSQKILMDEFSSKTPVWRPGKWKFQKNFWMSFPWFVNKG